MRGLRSNSLPPSPEAKGLLGSCKKISRVLRGVYGKKRAVCRTKGELMLGKNFAFCLTATVALSAATTVVSVSSPVSAGPTSAEPQLSNDINVKSDEGFPGQVVGVLDGVTYLALEDVEHGEELWRTDGTPEGTQLVKDIWPGSHGGVPSAGVVFNNELFFRAHTAENGRELWKTDGTEAGTQLVKDIYDGSGSSWVSDLQVLAGQLIFRADDDVHGYELWTSDGTTLGTQLLVDIQPGEIGSYPNQLVEMGGELFFEAAGTPADYELWKTDGTAVGTVLVKDIRAGSGSNPSELVAFEDDKILFAASDGIHGQELWISDGTEIGTQLVSDINNGSLVGHGTLLFSMAKHFLPLREQTLRVLNFGKPTVRK